MRKVYVALCLAMAISGQQVLLPGQNSISALIAEQPSELEPGYGSADDQWMLYDWSFDLLSEANAGHAMGSTRGNCEAREIADAASVGVLRFSTGSVNYSNLFVGLAGRRAGWAAGGRP